MVTTTPAAAAARLHSRGALLYTPPGPASTSCTGRVGRSLALGATSRARQQQAVVAAAAVLSNEQQRQTGYDSSSDVGQAVSLALDPSVWLEAERAASAAAAITGAASSAFFRPGRSQHSSNNQQRQGQYLGVYNTHEASSIPGKQPHASTPPHSAATAPSGKGSKSKGKAVRQAAAGPPTSGGVAAETLQLNSSRPRTRQLRQRNRSARPSPGRRAMHGAFDNILQTYQSEYESWLRSQEEALMQLVASNAPSSIIHSHTTQHDTLKRAWEEKWGPPVNNKGNRLRILPQAGAAGLGYKGPGSVQAQQQQQQLQPAAAAAAQSSRAGQGSSSRGNRPSSSSSGGAGIQRRVFSSALDIPDDTPEVLAEAAEATGAAGQAGSFGVQAAGAAVIIEAISQEPIDRETLDGIELVLVHLSLLKLVHWKLHHLLPVLAEYILSRPDRNEHSCGVVFNAYALANRLDLALATWDRLAAQGVDIGPIGSSALMKACAREMDLHTAKQVFEQLLRRRVTFNAYTYHCLLQLCGSAGSLDDALAVYNLQRLETQRANLPDSFTYTILVRAMLVSGRCELVQQVFENMLEDDIIPHPALYCNFLTAAGRAGNLSFARYLYQHMAVTLDLPPPSHVETVGLLPAANQQQRQATASAASQPGSSSSRAGSSRSRGGNSKDSSSSREGAGDSIDMLSLVNALLNAHAQVGALPGAKAIYKQELLGRGLQPDAYTCTALLTAAARLASGRLAWSQVIDIVQLTHHYGICLSTQLGTALINAYRRVRQWEVVQQQQAAAGNRRGNGKGRRPRSRARPFDAGSSCDEAEAADQQQEVPQQVQAQPVHSSTWEQEQLAAIGAPQLPGVPAVMCASIHAAQQVLAALEDSKLATSNSYVTLMCFLLEQDQVSAFKQLFDQATAQRGIIIDEQGWEKLAHAAVECGAGQLVSGLQQATLQRQWQQQQHLQQQQQQQQQQRMRQQQQRHQELQEQLAASGQH